MGTDDLSTVYAAELRAIEMVLDLVRTKVPSEERLDNGVTIFADSQAALKALRRPRMPSGQVYLTGCLDLINWLAARRIGVEFHWIPAHQGILGNETVDQNAENAAQEEICSQIDNNRYIRLAAAVKRRFREKATVAWENAWARETTGRPTKRLARMRIRCWAFDQMTEAGVEQPGNPI